MTHTPRPWKVMRFVTGELNIITDRKSGAAFCIAWMSNAAGDQADSNADLIAAAPELLEALKCARMEAPKRRKSAPFWIGVDELIAKAEGAENYTNSLDNDKSVG